VPGTGSAAAPQTASGTASTTMSPVAAPEPLAAKWSVKLTHTAVLAPVPSPPRLRVGREPTDHAAIHPRRRQIEKNTTPADLHRPCRTRESHPVATVLIARPRPREVARVVTPTEGNFPSKA